MQQGQRLGNPSYYVGFASGVHLDFGIKFQNVWQPIDAVILSGWQIENGMGAYQRAMTKLGEGDMQLPLYNFFDNVDHQIYSVNRIRLQSVNDNISRVGKVFHAQRNHFDTAQP